MHCATVGVGYDADDGAPAQRVPDHLLLVSGELQAWLAAGKTLGPQVTTYIQFAMPRDKPSTTVPNDGLDH